MLNVIKSEAEVKKARMALYESARQVLNNGMRVLGLSPVERYVLFFFVCSILVLVALLTGFLSLSLTGCEFVRLVGWFFVSFCSGWDWAC